MKSLKNSQEIMRIAGKVGFLPLTKSMQIKLLLSMKETLRLIDVKLNSITRAILMRVVKYVVSSTRRILDRIAQFGWSKGTYRNSFPVHAVFLLPIAFAATLAWHWTISVAEQIGAGQGWGPVLAFSFLKQTFAFVGFLIFTSFYIRWLVRNHRELVEGELGLRQFQLDVERASWAAETALEWRREEGTPMPDALI